MSDYLCPNCGHSDIAPGRCPNCGENLEALAVDDQGRVKKDRFATPTDDEETLDSDFSKDEDIENFEDDQE